METTKSLVGSLSSQADCRSRVHLEEKIKSMWMVIDELKRKVAEEREQLKKEKSENIKINEEAERLRKHLNMYHLPSCPKHNAPPCPIHSLGNIEEFLISSSQHDLSDAQGDQLARIQSYKEFFEKLDMDDQIQEVDVFDDPLSTDETGANNLKDNFTLLLSQHWQTRQNLGNLSSGESLSKTSNDTQQSSNHHQNQSIEESSCNF